MRRKDREITDDYQIDTIITSCNCCRLGFYDQDNVYIVPLSFGYEKKAGTRIFYFHSAKQGKKIQLMKTTTTPFSMNTVLEETLRAKPISWVTTSMVMPSSASFRMTESTSPVSSGSRALVGSSK